MSSDHSAGFDAGVVANADLSSHDDVVFDRDAAGEAGLGGDDYIFSELAVVADVNEIIDFCALADASFVEGSAVDGRVGSDFDVVFEDETADLRGLLVASCLRVADVAEAFTAEDGSGLDDDAIAKMDCGIDGDVGVDAAVRSDRDIVADYCAGADGGFIFDSYVFSDYGAGADGYGVGDPGGFRDNGGRMDGGSSLWTAEELGGSSEGEPWMRGDQQ